MEEDRRRRRRRGTRLSEIPDEALYCILDRIDDPRDRDSISLVCHQWHRVDSHTRKHVTVAFCYSAAPDMLRTRFPRLESLKLKGKPRASMFDLIPEDWGGYARPWIQLSSAFDCLKELHLRRMVVADEDIAALVGARGHALQSLKLDRCSGFSTDGLRVIASNCRGLRTLYLEESTITDNGGEWLNDLATNNTALLHLNFYLTDLEIRAADLELLARNCRSLISLKISECDLAFLPNFFKSASKLEEFGGGSFNVDPAEARSGTYSKVVFPSRLLSVGLLCMGTNEVSVVYPLCASLKKLDLQYTFLNTEDHCQLIQKCPNLEVLEVRNVIGDRGLEVVSNTCKKLRRLRVERGDDDPGQQNEQGRISQAGLMSIAVGCRELEYIAVYVSDISNAALEAFGTFSTNLRDFRLVLLDSEENIADLPLDNGVRALLRGCNKLNRFAFYLRPGGLSDAGLGYVGEYSGNIRYMLLGNVGESDLGLMRFAMGCKNLEKLELRSCCFSERALALAILQLPALRYVWVEGYKASFNGEGFREMRRRYWNIEFIPPRVYDEYSEENEEERVVGLGTQAQMLAYYSLAGHRMDLPEYAVHLFQA